MPAIPIRRKRKNEQGYALVLIMFFLALLVLSTVVAAPTVLSNIQREKEAEMVWRGKQYTRGIRMYYMKMHRFPTSLEDLTQPKNNIRFMRQAYKDPMNTVDGSWRQIYVGPNGQLIGSLNSQFLGLYGAATPNGLAGMGAPQNSGFGGSSTSFGTSFSNTGFGNRGSSSFGNSSFGNSGFGQNSTNPTDANQSAGAIPTAPATDPNAPNTDNSDQSGQPQSLNSSMDSSNTIGGNIIGVASKVNKKSFLWYHKAKDYRHFEFIWDPSKDTGYGQAAKGIGTPVQNLNGPGSGAPGTVVNGPGGVNPQQPNPSQNMYPGGDPNANPPLQAPSPN
jgi:hypothetical protein